VPVDVPPLERQLLPRARSGIEREREQRTLFGDDDLIKAGGNADVVEAFRDRLRTVAGFEEVPEPIPTRNSKNATVYYLFFASHNKTGAKIARHLLGRYATHGSREGRSG
jgi:hypothetical protein